MHLAISADNLRNTFKNDTQLLAESESGYSSGNEAKFEQAQAI